MVLVGIDSRTVAMHGNQNLLRSVYRADVHKIHQPLHVILLISPSVCVIKVL